MAADLTAGFRPRNLEHVLPLAAGALANMYVSQLIVSKFLPSWASGWKRLILNLGTAGVLTTLTGMVRKQYAVPVLTGAVLQSVIQGATPYVLPQLEKVVSAVSPHTPPAAALPVPAPALPAPVAGINEYFNAGTKMLPGPMAGCGCQTADDMAGIGEYMTQDAANAL